MNIYSHIIFAIVPGHNVLHVKNTASSTANFALRANQTTLKLLKFSEC